MHLAVSTSVVYIGIRKHAKIMRNCTCKYQEKQFVFHVLPRLSKALTCRIYIVHLPTKHVPSSLASWHDPSTSSIVSSVRENSSVGSTPSVMCPSMLALQWPTALFHPLLSAVTRACMVVRTDAIGLDFSYYHLRRMFLLNSKRSD